MDIIEVESLSKDYKDFKLENISFSVPKGEITGFIGPNGSGKTTTIKLLLNLIQKGSGKISFWGMEYPKNERSIKNRLGIVLDDGFFYNKLTIGQMKGIVAEAYDDWREEIFEEYMTRFSLNRNQKIETLSKGMKMKFALSLAMSHNAECLIMDEPAGGLDPLIRAELDDILLDYVADGEHTVFFSTHILSDLDKIADNIVLVNKGRLIFQKSKKTLLEEFTGRYYNIEEIMLSLIGGIENGCIA